MKKSQKGFTLVELIVVIAIIGVLAAILVPSMMGYVKKSKLKSANSNAKLVFTTVNGVVSDLVADGEVASITTGTHAATEVSGLSGSSDKVEAAVYEALKDNGDGAGCAVWEITTAYDVSFAQWADTTSATVLIGQYPNPESDPDATHTFGTSF